MTSAGSEATTEPAPEGGGVREHRYRVPQDATEILLVRHGESAVADPAVPFPLLDGQGDPELSAEGRAQAQLVAERLAREPLDAIYVSSLRRTLETATPLLERTGAAPIVTPDLREAHLGEWEGHLWRIRIAEGHPLALRMIDEQRWDIIPGAEPVDAFMDRVTRVLGDIATWHAGRAVAVFTHGGVIGAAMGIACEADPYPFNAADNASISQVVVTEDRWRIRRFNDTAHLAPLISTS